MWEKLVSWLKSNFVVAVFWTLSTIFGVMIGDLIATYFYGPLRKLRLLYLLVFVCFIVTLSSLPLLLDINPYVDVFTGCVYGFTEGVVAVLLARTILQPLVAEKKPKLLGHHEYYALDLLLQGKEDKEIVSSLVTRGLSPERAVRVLSAVKERVSNVSDRTQFLAERLGELQREVFDLELRLTGVEKRLADVSKVLERGPILE